MLTIHGSLLSPTTVDDCQVLPSCAVTIGDDGCIAAIDPGAAPGDSAGGHDHFILPGFIDAHLHLPQWDRRGIDGLSIERWQEQVGYPAEARTADETFAEALAEQFVSGLVQRGTTTVAAMSSPFAPATEAAFRVFARRGYRAIFGMTLNDTDMPEILRQEPDRALDESRALAAKWHGTEGGRLLYAFCPRNPVKCSEKLMRGAAALSEMLGCHLHTHASESLLELTTVRDRFPDLVDVIDLYAEMGLLTPRTLLAHGVFLNTQQRRQVARAGTAVVHCPTANLFRETGMMDFVAHRAAGIRMAFGSSVAGGPEPFMPRVAVEAIQTAKAIKVHAIPRSPHPAPSPAEAWYSLTQGAAEALGLGQRIGALAVGKDADLLVVRPEPWLRTLPPEQQVSALLYTLCPQQIEQVYIAGRRVNT